MISLSDYLSEAIERLELEQIYNHPAHAFKEGNSNGKLRGGCCFHQSQSGSSFVVDDSKLFWCEGCQFGGGPADYRASLKAGQWIKARGDDFREAVRELAAEAGISLPESSLSPEQVEKAQFFERRRAILQATAECCQNLLWSNIAPAIEARAYLIQERGLTEEHIRQLGLGLYLSHQAIRRQLKQSGFTSEDWRGTGCVWEKLDGYIIFPWLDASGRPLTLYGRYMKAQPTAGKPKTIALPGKGSKSSLLYFDRAIASGHKRLILVEGVLDAALLQAQGDTRVCAYVAASCSSEQIQALKRRRIETVTLCGDPDHGGEKGTNSNLSRLIKAGISVFVAPELPDGLDPDEFVNREGLAGWNSHIAASEHGFRWKARKLIDQCIDGTDVGKVELLQVAKAFVHTIADSPLVDQLETFFWPLINEALGVESAPGQAVEPPTVRPKVISKIPLVCSDDGEEELPQPSVVATILAEIYRDQLAWNTETQQFYRYGVNYPGLWQAEHTDFVQAIVQAELDAVVGGDPEMGYTAHYVGSVLKLMQGYLAVRQWNEQQGLLPLRNGVLELATRKLLPHSPGYRLTWQLPYDYSPLATCEPIQTWMLEAMKGDQSLVELLRAFLNAILKGRTDLQRFLECLGPGGTGKSTYARLAIALVGIENTFTTELKHLEQNRFESAGIYGKRLVLIADSERYGGSITTVKALTGQDPLRFEQKNRQQGSSFMPKAMVMICANEPIQSADYTSGLQRRRLTVPFIYQVKPTERRDLITVTSTTLSGEFVPYLPGLLNWVLAIPDERVTDLIVNTETTIPSLNQWKAESLLESNPIAEWLDAQIIVDPKAKNYVGRAIKIRLTEGEPANTVAWDTYRNADRWLYANYVEFATYTGSKAISIRRFGDLLEDLCNSQLNLGVKRGRDREGSFFEGITIRKLGENTPGPITQQFSQPVTPGCSTTKKGMPPATGHETPPTVTGCDGNVTAESFASKGCDGCDGLFGSESIEEDLNKYTLPHKNAFSLYREEKAGKSVTSITSNTGGTSSHPTIRHNPSQELPNGFNAEAWQGLL